MNRVVNAESANLRRAVEAAHRQLSNIQVLEQTNGLRRLSRRTRRVVAARRRSPEATFGELATAVGLSRSQVQRAFYEVESAALHHGDGA
jgi:DNA-binding protein WhiA